MPQFSVTESLQLRSAELDMNMRQAPPVQVAAQAQVPLMEVLADEQASWAFSKDGANGAMLVRTGVEATGGVAIKVENAFTAGAVDKTARMMETFFKNAQGEAPFAAPRVTMITPTDLIENPVLAQGLKTRLETLKEAGVHDAVRVDDQIKRLQDVENGTSMVVKMEFAQGTQINKMPLADRLALAQTDAFPQALGKALPVFAAMGLNDHLGLIETNFKNNAANLMFDAETGQISAIDFSTGTQFDPEMPNNEKWIVFAEDQADQSIKRLNNFLERTLKDEASFNAAVQRMAEGKPTALTPALEAFVSPEVEVHMFDRSEADAVEAYISLEDRKRFAANLILGCAQGLDYLKVNEPALRQAVLATHEMVEGRKLEHIHSTQTVEALGVELEKVKGPELIAKAELLSIPCRLEALNQQAGPLKVALDQATAKLDRLENKPTLKDRLTFLVKNRDEVIQEARKQQVNLLLQAEEMVKESHRLMNRQSEAAYTQEQAEKVQAAAVNQDPNHEPEQGQGQGQGHENAPEEIAREAAPVSLREQLAAERNASSRRLDQDERMDIKTPKVKIPRKM